mmetsp:Transcript_35311/g.57123  ORF Transcript_35311/g.57123 Transcript_35311/m.57123 type:complete len:745 (-) Transcript_35311:658-2892(-)|eukprot:CAMPEP_0184672980 /NCGR_PEP_ID=MMETSP0308-20130426/86423_1 /TAXON_ID=38269 /ORGANISM="Gloeochaete witrockiana, Strain SAG 46.84" /LENGTH=744 /DNA_ID=CAMNT_0027120411 /DNA_START=31 /DNA_END=2265 /DNA_ORIENTATION=+
MFRKKEPDSEAKENTRSSKEAMKIKNETEKSKSEGSFWRPWSKSKQKNVTRDESRSSFADVNGSDKTANGDGGLELVLEEGLSKSLSKSSVGFYSAISDAFLSDRIGLVNAFVQVLRKDSLLTPNGPVSPEDATKAFASLLKRHLDTELSNQKKDRRAGKQKSDKLGDTFWELRSLFLATAEGELSRMTVKNTFIEKEIAASTVSITTEPLLHQEEICRFAAETPPSSLKKKEEVSNYTRFSMPAIDCSINSISINSSQSKEPKPPPYALHKAVYVNDDEKLLRLLRTGGMDVDEVDLRGNTALHLAVKFGNISMVHLLLEHGAQPRKKNTEGWNALDEAITMGDEEIVTAVYVALQQRAYTKWQTKKDLIISALRKLPDFYLELKWEFDSLMLPFINAIAPSDVYRIWKRGSSLRIDTTLVGFDNLRAIRGDASMIFTGADTETPGNVYILDREDKTVIDAFERLRDPTSEEVHDEVESLLQTDLMQGKFSAKNIALNPAKSFLGNAKIETVGQWKSAKVYEGSGNFVARLQRKKISSRLKEDGSPPRHNKPHSSHPHQHSNTPKHHHHPSVPDDMPSFEEYFDPSKLLSSDINRSPEKVIPTSKLTLPRSEKSATKQPEPKDPLTDKAHPKSKTTEFKRKMKATVWLSDEFPIRMNDLLPVFDILSKASTNKYISKVKDILTLKFPLGLFPVKVSVPLVLSVHVLATFQKFELSTHIEESVFAIPSDFRPRLPNNNNDVEDS